MVSLNNALIDMYAKSGHIRKALQVFKNAKYKTVITWTTMIAGLALHGLGRQALDMFAQMERAKIAPNDITFIAILSACSHAPVHGFIAGDKSHSEGDRIYEVLYKLFRQSKLAGRLQQDCGELLEFDE
ncbi:hypothetical protein M0R45_018073 [Rubus argutus]|uniref:Pentatricopeptide repeat-containing protein n=1 Tax=Rubus argutus TaxID=59490 RepID=A0AAW1XY88_RUBAR